MSNFSNSLNFLRLKDGLTKLGLDPSWCENKEEAVNAVLLYFDKHNLKLEYQCPNCGGDLPELDFCPFCCEQFKDIKETPQDEYVDGVFKLRYNNKPVEKNIYGDITVYKLQHSLRISEVNPFGWQAFSEIKNKLFIPECLINKHKHEEKYSIKDPWSEIRPFSFSRTLVVVKVYRYNIMLQFRYPKESYSEYGDRLKKLKKPIGRLLNSFSIDNKKDLAIGIKLIVDTFKLSKEEHEVKGK